MFPRPRAPFFRRLLPGMAVLVACLSGCGEGGESLFPLDEGWSWEYSVTSETRSGHIDVYRFFVTNLAPVILNGRRVVPRLRSDGGMAFYGETPEGVMWYGEKIPGKAFVPPAEGNRVIGNPGESISAWKARDRTKLLRSIVQRNLAIDIPVTIGYGLESTHEAVSVPAGDFTDCLKVRGEGRARFDGGALLGMIDIEVETSDWYAPGIGLVKSVRRENSSSKTMSYGEYVMELEAFNQGS